MDKKLLFSITKNDFEIQTFRSGGKGGQNQNKVNSGVRIIHKDSGARGESREERSQAQNKKNAFRRLVESKTFQTWLKMEASARILGFQNLEKKIDEMMDEKNLKIEIVKDGEWNA